MEHHEQYINELTYVLKEIANGRCCVALAGAHAKGSADADSDIDFHIFLDELKPYESLIQIIEKAADKEPRPIIQYDYEKKRSGYIVFSYKKIPVEVCVFSPALVEPQIESHLEGEFEILPETWTSNGKYTYTVLSEISFLKPLWDPDGILCRYKAKVAVYPEKLQTAIIKRFWSRASLWIGNFHYESAIKREDVLFTAPIVLHTILDMVQVIFALNKTYFNGDKKLAAGLAKLPYCPEQLLENLEFLLCARSDAKILHKQYDILRAIHDELELRVKPFL